jgi:hypothetical protein
MKKSSSRSSGFWDDFSQWVDSSEGAESMDALDCVFNALDGAGVDPIERRIIGPDSESLSIGQSIERIRKTRALMNK